MRMFVLDILILVFVVAMAEDQRDPVADQILIFKDNTEGPIGVLTTKAGAPVPYHEATNTLNTELIDNEFFMDVLDALSRERIPERVVHAKGTGAFGYFKVTHDISHICKADFLKKVGMKTPVAVRFSTAVGNKGSSDLALDFRGFAVKFYTHEGNFDIAGFNTPMYLYNEPLHIQPVIHAARRNPATNILDPNMLWDLLTLVPETIHITLLVFSGRGLPASYRNMPGFGIHTYQVENKYGEPHYARFHFIPDGGIENLSSEKALNLTALEPDYLTKDLYRAIGNGDFPSWTVSVQILTKEDIKKTGTKMFDSTRVIPLKEFPLHEIGKLVLNRNAKNFFAEIEQLAFCPGNLVPGILGSPDKLFQARRLAYRDTQLYRLGGNFKKIPVNCPFQTKVYTYNRDGVPPVGDNEEDAPNYYPNSFNGPAPYMAQQSSRLIKIVEKRAYNFDQAAELYENELTTEERTELIKNLVFSLGPVTKFLQDRAIKIFTTIHKDLGFRVARGLNSTTMYYKS
ncbi:catalase-like isoform X2 [Maniola jurtina]|nr:catalase-like isoform X2 [Maniola jurtina]XP_045764435.1 catalase-like isoform X2 [Maniola jurtina]XP_045764436.1 catalase-like isoform X2 [Maniola jurtina]XP_045764437.1 catalase-like isoform X2 [Maniola jurtina]XP_045764438.1 catalase-like isoform X2 [Maniola jurtina]XP_045764439.1 catalase-like isoform X2 [Maniola jurtina]XP_045764440.1 catalase-like isoform X2 [Maniola jurtina]XP_045764441.1 catalase-like isoform X2 [Maniola jurtina]